jgi:hypothetical protein
MAGIPQKLKSGWDSAKFRDEESVGNVSSFTEGEGNNPIPKYRYNKFSSKDEIRLLNLHPGMTKDPLFFSIDHEILPSCACVLEHLQPRLAKCRKCRKIKELPNFEALSYTWGEKNQLEIVHCQASDHSKSIAYMKVTSNCASALKRLRHAVHVRKLWVDAICIDQSNTNERSAQVRIMQRMYRGASQVIVYLGDSTDGTDRAIEILEHESQGLSPLITDDISKKDIQCVQELVARPWFHRVWVLQEIASARSAVVLCGEHPTAWNQTFHRNMDSWLGYHPDLSPFPHVMNFGPAWQKKNVFSPNGFFEQLCKTRVCGATEPHDKIYAVLSLFSDIPQSVCLKIDYSRSVVDLFTATAAFLLGSIGPALLEQVLPSRNIDGLPSWVPDWTIQHYRAPSPPRSDLFDNIQPDWATERFGGPSLMQNKLFGPWDDFSLHPDLEIQARYQSCDVVRHVAPPCSCNDMQAWKQGLLVWMALIEVELLSRGHPNDNISTIEEFFDVINPSVHKEYSMGGHRHIYAHVWESLKSWCKEEPQPQPPKVLGFFPTLDWPKISMQSMERVLQRSLVISENLKLPGLASNNVAVGDGIWRTEVRFPLEIGCASFYHILRPRSTKSYTFVGDCDFNPALFRFKYDELLEWETIIIH